MQKFRNDYTFFFPVKGFVIPVHVGYEVNWAPGPIFDVIEKLTGKVLC